MRKKKNPWLLTCALCDHKAARIISTSRVFGRGPSRVLIENIPLHSCQNCHGQYIEANVMDAIDAIRTEPARYTAPQPIATVRLAA